MWAWGHPSGVPIAYNSAFSLTNIAMIKRVDNLIKGNVYKFVESDALDDIRLTLSCNNCAGNWFKYITRDGNYIFMICKECRDGTSVIYEDFNYISPSNIGSPDGWYRLWT